MKIRGDLLKISSGALNVKGEKLEPEQQLVRREVSIDINTKLGMGAHGTDVGSIPGSIVTDSTAIETARNLQHLCGNCRFFRNDLWIRDLNKNDAPDAPIEKRRAINKIRGAILQTQDIKISEKSAGQDGDLDVEHALRSLGYCQALFEFMKGLGKSKEDAMTLVHPASACPEDVRSTAAPHGFFEFASKEAEKQASKNYDAVLNVAAGKK